ncbi:MAG: hypothetical protein KF757_11150 [Phycisphaeraceae bacterium]|nr:hypothetical protein [Phycisphaeraceae bacterium]MCW5762245.1 hypothetical protein [Phycisphaeraceae bacterium]
MKVFGRSLVVAALFASACFGQVQLNPDEIMPIDNDPRVRFDHHHLVEVHTHSEQELETVLALIETVWSERVGVGSLLVQFPPHAMAQLKKLGIEHEIVHPNVQELIDEEWDQLRTLSQQRGLSWFQTYRQLGEYTTRLNELQAAHPTLARLAITGQSIQARDIPVIHITAPGDASSRPVVFIVGGQHAREWISGMTVMYLAESLLEGYGTDPRITDILDTTEIIIAPIANPDGYVYTWTNNRLWRKNRRGGYGVDLNRNWGYEWGGAGSSGNTGNDTYRGTAPFSEPETNALRLYAQADPRVVSHIDYHSYSQLILWPWGYGPVDPPMHEYNRFHDLCHDMRDAILDAGGVPYLPQPSYELYSAAGVAADWFYGSLGASGITIELRDTGNFGFELPPAQIIPTAQENLPAFLMYVERTTLPLSMSLAAPAPEVINSSGQTLDLTITAVTSSYYAGSATLHYRVNGGSFNTAPLTPITDTTFLATFPNVPCGTEIEYYFSALATNNATVTLPANGDESPFAAQAVDIAVPFFDDVESGTNGWTAGAPGDTATVGQWERGIPQATAAQPGADHTPNGQYCWITGAASGGSLGANDVDNGITTLISPIIDASAAAANPALDAYIIYHRWYSNDQGAAPNADSMPIDISNNDGQTWTQLELVAENLNRWERKEFRIRDFVEPTSQMRVRFIARDLGSGSIVEAAIDDVWLEIRGCPCAPADFNCDGNLDFFDVQAFLTAFSAQDPAGDFNGDGEFNFFDVQAFLTAFSGG